LEFSEGEREINSYGGLEIFSTNLFDRVADFGHLALAGMETNTIDNFSIEPFYLAIACVSLWNYKMEHYFA